MSPIGYCGQSRLELIRSQEWLVEKTTGIRLRLFTLLMEMVSELKDGSNRTVKPQSTENIEMARMTRT